MKLCNDTITVFNKRLEAASGDYVYVPTVISGVSWYGKIGVNLGDKGLNAANEYIIRIPADADTGGKSYVDPIAYCSETLVSGLWTLANGDIIAKAAITDETLTPAKIKEAYTCCTILATTDNRRAPNAPHFKVVGN